MWDDFWIRELASLETNMLSSEMVSNNSCAKITGTFAIDFIEACEN